MKNIIIFSIWIRILLYVLTKESCFMFLQVSQSTRRKFFLCTSLYVPAYTIDKISTKNLFLNIVRNSGDTSTLQTDYKVLRKVLLCILTKVLMTVWFYVLAKFLVRFLLYMLTQKILIYFFYLLT